MPQSDVCVLFFVGVMDELQSLDPRRQELLEARFTGGVSGSTGSTGSCSVGAKVSGSFYVDGIAPVGYFPLVEVKRLLPLLAEGNRCTVRLTACFRQLRPNCRLDLL